MFISEFVTHLGMEGRIKKTFIYSYISPCWVLVATCWIFHCNAGLSSCRGVCSVIQLCPTLYNPMDCSTPGFPVLYHLLELAQTHVHWVGDAIQSSYLCHPLLLLPSMFASMRVFFKWVSSLHQMAKVLEFQLQHQSFQWILRTDFFWNWLVWSPCSPRDSRVFSNTTVQKHQFFGAQLSLRSNSHPYMNTGKTTALPRRTFVGKVMSLLFNMLSRLVITFLPRRKHLLISWLQSPSAVILEPPE